MRNNVSTYTHELCYCVVESHSCMIFLFYYVENFRISFCSFEILVSLQFTGLHCLSNILITAQGNEEDWAARARAWADAKTALESQQSQFAPTGRLEEQNYYHDQYSQPINSNHPDMSHQPPPATYEQFPASVTSVARPPAAHHLESTPVTVSSEQSSYLSDGRPTYSVSEGSYGGNVNSVLHHQGKLSSSPSVHQQEVPCSNYSVTGNDSLVYECGVVIAEESCFQTHLVIKLKFFFINSTLYPSCY